MCVCVYYVLCASLYMLVYDILLYVHDLNGSQLMNTENFN